MKCLSLFALLPPLLGFLCQCQSVSTSNSAAGTPLTEEEKRLIRESFVPHPLPEKPNHAKVVQTCMFFVTNPKDQSMVPVGLIKQKSYVIVRQEDGEWTDIQLSTGHYGSVISANLRSMNAEEKASGEHLMPQPDLTPLSLPQARTNEVRPFLDPVLLDG